MPAGSPAQPEGSYHHHHQPRAAHSNTAGQVLNFLYILDFKTLAQNANMCAKRVKESLTQYLSGTFSLAPSQYHHQEEKFIDPNIAEANSKTQILQGQIFLRPKYCRGKFGVVYHVKDRKTDRCYAAKHIRIRKAEQKEKVRKKIQKFRNVK